MKRLRASLLGSLLALAAACGLDAQAQVASPPPGKALVVLYRNDKQPVAARVPVIVNADRLGDLGHGEFMNAVVNPGRTFLRVGDRILTTLAIQANANQTSYVLVEAVPVLTPVRVEMRQMTEPLARRILAQSRPAAAGAVAAAPAPRAPAAGAPLVVAPAAAPPPPRPAAPPPAAAPPPPRPVQPSPPPQPARGPLVREPVAAEEAEEAEEAERGKWRIAVIAKTGAFKLATTSQTISGLATAYDKSSKPVAAFEAEMRHVDGFAIGAEVLYYKNEITLPGTAFTGQQSVVSTTVNAKYYLGGDTGVFHPFLGAGAGFAGASFGGDFQGKSSGPSFQGMLGVDLRFSSVGLYLEYKYVSSTTSDSTNQKIKIGGSGVLAGLSLDF